MDNKPMLFIINHGEFGKSLIESAELIVGPIDNIYAFSLIKGMSLEELAQIVEEKLSKVKQAIVLTDLFGGTPNNVAMYLQSKYCFPIISGVNLPMLLDLILARDSADKDLKTMILDTVSIAKDSIQYHELQKGEDIDD